MREMSSSRAALLCRLTMMMPFSESTLNVSTRWIGNRTQSLENVLLPAATASSLRDPARAFPSPAPPSEPFPRHLVPCAARRLVGGVRVLPRLVRAVKERGGISYTPERDRKGNRQNGLCNESHGGVSL